MKMTWIVPAIFATAILAACDNNIQIGQPSATDSTTVSATDSTETTAEDKSKRESPLKEATFNVDNTRVHVVWGAPKVKGRTIWGELVPYGEVWRTGANEATTIEFSEDVKVEGKAIPAGKYGLFTIPEAKQWTIIFNNVPDQWGAYEYEKAKDQLRITVKPETAEFSESLNFGAENDKVYVVWDKLRAGFKVSH